jgi:hypothetical protein
MSSPGRDNELRKLYRKRDASSTSCSKFILVKLAVLGCSSRCKHETISSNLAEELTDNWATAEADNRLPRATTELQRLLSEHQEICRRIIDVLDMG